LQLCLLRSSRCISDNPHYKDTKTTDYIYYRHIRNESGGEVDGGDEQTLQQTYSPKGKCKMRSKF
jgi:hypothetical protein